LLLRFEILNLLATVLTNPINPGEIESLIKRLSIRFDVNLLDLAHHELGIANPIDFDSTGELILIHEILKGYMNNDSPTLFDIGANTGNYSLELRRAFPNAAIWAFEPNPKAFERGNERLTPLGVRCSKQGLGAKPGKSKVYTYTNDPLSQHASIYKNVFLDLHKSDNLSEFEFELTTIDEFCDEQDIHFIDFMKIDTEGHELEVLRGAERMLRQDRIGIIQFEFNTLHVISRVFLKDFYELLTGHDIYRLNKDRLMPLREYDTANEIFRFQNLFAVRKDSKKAAASSSS
jgi:FkbM family methyltransferase